MGPIRGIRTGSIAGMDGSITPDGKCWWITGSISILYRFWVGTVSLIELGFFLTAYKANQPDYLTWWHADYGESHYIGPIRSDQPNSQAWVDGFDHHGVWRRSILTEYHLQLYFVLGWLEMAEYYATAFKTGSYPVIKKDKVYLWARPHPASANAINPAAPRPNNADWVR